MNKKIVVIGTGYVGLPCAIMLAKNGRQVIGVDINENIVRAINDGVLHIKEKDLQLLMETPEVKRNLNASKTPVKGDVFIIAVPTPIDPKKKICDYKFVTAALESIVPFLEKGNLIILESTVPPLTCRNIIIPILKKAGFEAGRDILLAHCPERILPGNIFYEIANNDRIIGGINSLSTKAAKEVYKTFVKGQLYETDDITAEMCKLMENTFRDVNIALSNEFSLICEGLGIDVHRAIEVANKHPRVRIMSPGIGVGGHCIPLDPWFIKEIDPENSRLIQMARWVNDGMPQVTAARIRKKVRDIKNPRILALGATYKPDTEDTRESPAIEVVRILREDGYCVKHYDPLVKEMSFPEPPEKMLEKFDAVVILVEHRIFRKLVSKIKAKTLLIRLNKYL